MKHQARKKVMPQRKEVTTQGRISELEKEYARLKDLLSNSHQAGGKRSLYLKAIGINTEITKLREMPGWVYDDGKEWLRLDLPGCRYSCPYSSIDAVTPKARKPPKGKSLGEGMSR